MNDHRKTDLAIGLAAAIVLHALLFCWSGQGFCRDADVMAEFTRGRTSILLTVVPVIEEPVTEEAVLDPDSSVVTELVEEPPPPVQTVPLEGGAEDTPFTTIGFKPRYPRGSRIRGEQGTVVLNLTIDDNGKVTYAAVKESSGYHALDRAALNSVKQARFVSATNPDLTFAGTTEFSIRYELE